MKKIFAICLSLIMLMALLTGCTNTAEPVVTPMPETTTEPSMTPELEDGIIDGEEEKNGMVDDDHNNVLDDDFEMEPDIKDATDDVKDYVDDMEIESDIMK